MIGWCTEPVDNLVVGRVVGETNKGHSFFIIVGRPVFMAGVVSNGCPASCPSAEDATLVAVDDCVVQESTALGRPIPGVEGLPCEWVWEAFNNRQVIKCLLDAFVYKTDGDDDGSCGPHNCRNKMACRTMVGAWWDDSRESAVGGVVRRW
jgi:hypothetical protein